MTRGVLIFAHNNREVDYALLSLISGGLAKKHLRVPVSLATDKTTIEWCKESVIYEKMIDVFDKIIEVEKPLTDNKRNLHDGAESKSVPFVNTNRYSAWDITPYQRTLLLDSDYLVFSSKFSAFWDVDESVMIAPAMQDIYNSNRIGYHDRYISDTGTSLYWATTVMFTKDNESKLFFDLVQYIRDNYQYYADLFRFDSRQFRNDIAFSIAKHILDGFQYTNKFNLPPVLTIQDRDMLYDVSENEKLTFFIATDYNKNYVLSSTKGLDLHIMNKQSVIRNKDKFLALI